MGKGFVIRTTNWPEKGNYRVLTDSQGKPIMDEKGRRKLGFGSQYLNSTKDRLYSHIAVIGNYVASCITFISPSKVPAGKMHNVSQQIVINQFILIWLINFLHQNL